MREVHPNRGIEMEYRRRLMRLISDMQHSVTYWLSARYKQNQPRIAQDATPASVLQAEMDKLGKQWLKNFDEGAEKLSAWFAQKTKNYADGTLALILKDAGFSVDFTMTSTMRDAYHAVINEQVGLIKSIPRQYLLEVQGMVMRSVQAGRDLSHISQELAKRYGITKRRAALISRDQNNKATSVISRVRQQELGITEAVWRHSHAGKEPRPSHLKADGERYEIAKGMYLDGEWVWPGEKINCLPGRSIISSNDGCRKLWRRWYCGELTVLVTESGETIEATPNHPILTQRGWVGIQAVNLGEYLVKASNQGVDRFNTNIQRNNSTFSQLFDAASLLVRPSAASGAAFEFHGDRSDEEVQTIDIEGLLPKETNSSFCQKFAEFFFPNAYPLIDRAARFDGRGSESPPWDGLFGAPESVIRGFRSVLALIRGHARHADAVRLRLIADLNSMLEQSCADSCAGNPVFFRKLKLAQAGLVIGDDQIVGELAGIMSRASSLWDRNAPTAEMLGENVRVAAELRSAVFNGGPRQYLFDRIVDKRVIEFSHFVYNLESGTGWYTGNGLIVHNCRCTGKPVIPGFN